MSESEIKLEMPDDTLTISLRSGRKDLFMSAGLIRELISYVDDNQKFLGMWTDQTFQLFLMHVVLAPRDEKGKITTDDVSIVNAEIGVSESRVLLKWIEDHILYFFIENAETAKRAVTGPALTKLVHLLSGSALSAEQKQSAGPTDATLETA